MDVLNTNNSGSILDVPSVLAVVVPLTRGRCLNDLYGAITSKDISLQSSNPPNLALILVCPRFRLDPS